AFIFYGSASGLGHVAHPIEREGHPRTKGYGHAVGTAGDVNGDGYDDVIVGTFWYDAIPLQRAYLYLGSAAGLDREVAWTFESAVPYSGRAFGTIGDINGDGYADIAV